MDSVVLSFINYLDESSARIEEEIVKRATKRR